MSRPYSYSMPGSSPLQARNPVSSARDLGQYGSLTRPGSQGQLQHPNTTPGSLGSSRYGAAPPGAVRQTSASSTAVRTTSNDSARRAGGPPGSSFNMQEGSDGRSRTDARTPQRSPSSGQEARTPGLTLQRSPSAGNTGAGAQRGPDSGRSPSPPQPHTPEVRQSSHIRSMSETHGRRQLLREKDEELNKLKEQMVVVMKSRQTEDRDKINLENDWKKMNAAKQNLAAQKMDLQKENKRLKDAVTKVRSKAGPRFPYQVPSPTAAQDRSVLAARENVAQLEQQIQEKKEDLKVVEDMLKGEINRLTKQCDTLSQNQTSMDEVQAQRAEKVSKEVQELKALSGPNKEAQYAIIEQSLEKSLQKQQQLQERLHQVNKDKSRLEEEWAKAEYEWERRWEACQDERVQWQRQREEAMAQRNRLEKVEAMCKQNVASLQEKLEAFQKKEEDVVEEKRSLQGRVRRLQADLQRSKEDRENAMQTRGKNLEIEVGALQIEIQKLRAEVQTLRTQKEDSDSKCSSLRTSVEKLEQNQRFSGGRSGSRGPGGRAPSIRSLSSRGSTRFRASLKGQNCSMTVDGGTVTRTKGCRQCVVIGDHSLDLYPGVGWYFELRVNEVVTGWVGGLGLGITLTKPSQVAALPDRAWRIPNSWMAGYWGRMFTNGQQHLIDWKPQDLKTNDKVGFLVTPRGACIVYVNGEEKVHFSDVPVPVEGADVEMTALVDVFASTASVSIVESQPPEAAMDEEDEEPEDEDG